MWAVFGRTLTGVLVLGAVLLVDLDRWKSRVDCNVIKLKYLRELVVGSNPESFFRSPAVSDESQQVETCRHAGYLLGRIALQTGQLERAESLLSKDIDESYPFPRLWLGRLCLQQSRISEAERIWSTIPSVSSYLCHLGQSLAGSGDRGLARSVFEIATRISPQDPNAHYLLGEILVGSPEADQSLGIRHLNRALNGSLRDAWVFYLMGLAHERLNEKRAACKDYESSLQVYPGHTSSMQRLRLLLASEGLPAGSSNTSREND